MSLILRSSKAFPLTNTELDGNFTFLNSSIDTKLAITDFTSTSVLLKITSGPQGESSGIDASKVRGFVPTNQATANTIVTRDVNGDFQAREIFVELIHGKSTDSDHADTADTALTVTNTLPINKGGTGAITAPAARASLGAVHIAGDTLTGKLTLCPTTTTLLSLNIPKTTLIPTTPVEGDVWHDLRGLHLSTGGISKSIAFTDTNITGTSSNITGVVSIINGGTGTNTKDSARVALDAAKNGVNADITQLTALNTPILVGTGGTGLTSSGPVGNFLMSTGTTWESKDVGIPIVSGAVMAYYRTTAPTGWLECNGAAVSRVTYNDLWAAMGNPNTGDLITTFKLPDLRGEFIRGWDHARGLDVGRPLGSWQDHDWKGFYQTDTGMAAYGGANGQIGKYAHQFIYMGKSITEYIGNLFTGYWAAPAAAIGTKWDGSEVRPRNVALMYCIKT